MPKTLIASTLPKLFQTGEKSGLSVTNLRYISSDTVSQGLLRREKNPQAVNVGSKHDETEIYNRITSLRCTTLHCLQNFNFI